MNCELGISLSANALLWMNGTFPAGKSDNKAFKKLGLKAKLESLKKWGTADGVHPGHPTLLSR